MNNIYRLMRGDDMIAVFSSKLWADTNAWVMNMKAKKISSWAERHPDKYVRDEWIQPVYVKETPVVAVTDYSVMNSQPSLGEVKKILYNKKPC